MRVGHSQVCDWQAWAFAVNTYFCPLLYNSGNMEPKYLVLASLEGLAMTLFLPSIRLFEAAKEFGLWV